MFEFEELENYLNLSLHKPFSERTGKVVNETSSNPEKDIKYISDANRLRIAFFEYKIFNSNIITERELLYQ